MNKWTVFLCVMALVGAARASWYWPFGSDDDDEPRLSELMEDATEMIDDATELAAEGKTQEAVAKYREALMELANVEARNPERAATTEFTSLRNKRAYVNAAIDSLLLSEARSNAKAVAVTDTTELEKKFMERKNAGNPVVEAPATEKKSKGEAVKETAKKVEKKAEKKVEKKAGKKSMSDRLLDALKKDPKNRKLRLALIGERIKEEKYKEAMEAVEVLLKENMTDSSALNLKAVCEASQGDFKEAEKTLDLAIQSNPRDFNGYYNMANLKLQGSGNKDIARRYYETGRALGGPKDEGLEEAVR